MPDVLTAPTVPDTGQDTSDVAHTLCCVDDTGENLRGKTVVALCGREDQVWDNTPNVPSCVMCQQAVQRGDCPRYGRCTNQDTDIQN